MNEVFGDLPLDSDDPTDDNDDTDICSVTFKCISFYFYHMNVLTQSHTLIVFCKQ